MVAHWTFDEGTGNTAADSSGSGYHGTLVNGPTWTTGIIGGALRFDGNDDYVQVNLPELAPPWTVTAWVKWENSDANKGFLIQSANGGIRLEQYAGFHKLCGSKSGVYQYRHNFEAASNEWVHVAIVGTVSYNYIFINGAQQKEFPVTQNLPLKTISCSGPSFKGVLDDIRVYNRALITTEIRALIPPLPPKTHSDTYAMYFEGSRRVTPGVLQNDADSNSQFFSAVLESNPIHGTVVFEDSGAFTYTAPPGYKGLDTFTYWATDGVLQSPPETVSLFVGGIEDGLVAYFPGEGGSAEDKSGNGNTLVSSGFGIGWTEGIIGQALPFSSGGFYQCYLPNEAHFATQSFSVSSWIFGLDGASTFMSKNYGSDVQFSFSLNAQRRLEFMLKQSDGSMRQFTGTQVLQSERWYLTTAVVDKSTNQVRLYVNAQNEPLSVSSIWDGTLGVVDVPTKFGTDWFGKLDEIRMYNRAITEPEIAALMKQPAVAIDDVFSVAAGSTLTVNGQGVLANDSDANGDLLSAELDIDVEHGILNLNTNGSFVYVPDTGFTGTDTFVYRANDGKHKSPLTTVTIFVGGIPPGLYAHWQFDEGAGFIAGDSSGHNRNGALANGPTWTNGVIGSGLHFDGINDNVVLNLPDLPPPWTAAMWVRRFNNPSYSMSALFESDAGALTLEQNDGTHRVGISDYSSLEYRALNYRAPQGMWTHLSFVCTSTGTQLFANGNFVLTTDKAIRLPLRYIGRYIAPLCGDLDDVRIYNRVLSANEIQALARIAPQVSADLYSVTTNQTLSVGAPGVLANDVDPNGDAFTAFIQSNAVHGNVTLNADGSFNYTPFAGFSGKDSFTYTAQDSGGLNSVLATVTIRVLNGAPRVAAMNPSPNQVALTSTSEIELTFNEPVDTATLNSSNLTLVFAGTDELIGTVDDQIVSASTIDVTATSLKFKVPTPLADGIYSFKATSGFSGISDLSGEVLDGEFSGLFPSGNGSEGGDFIANFTVNSVQPAVISVLPPDGATAVSLLPLIQLTFNESMNKDTVAAALSVSPIATFSLSWSGNTVTVIPVQQLLPETLYTVTLTTLAQDSGGRSLTAPYSFSFTTQAFQVDSITPSISTYNKVVTNAVIKGKGFNLGSIPVPPNAVVYNNHSYLYVSTAMDWPSAKAYCESQGGHLVTLSDIEEQNFVKSLCPSNISIWLGFSDTANEGQFVWVTGEPVTFTNWGGGEPNNSGNEDYTELYTNGAWNDIGNTTRTFVCEFDALAGPKVTLRKGVSSIPSVATTRIDSTEIRATFDLINAGIGYYDVEVTNTDQSTAVLANAFRVTHYPPAALKDYYSTAPGQVLPVASPGVLANDRDPELASLSAQLVVPPALGSLVFNTDGSFTFTPPSDFYGTVTFTYRSFDGEYSSADTTVTIAVSSTVNALADLNSLHITHMVLDPARKRLYATATDYDLILFIETETMSVEKTLYVGRYPYDLDIDADNNRLYIGTAGQAPGTPGSATIAIVDLNSQTRMVDYPIPISYVNNDLMRPVHVKAGRSGRLYYNGGFMFNGGTGRVMNTNSGADLGGFDAVKTNIVMNPGRTRAYCQRVYTGNLGEMGMYDISTDSVALIGSNRYPPYPYGWSGDNPYVISGDGNKLGYDSVLFNALNLQQQIGVFPEAVFALNYDGKFAVGGDFVYDTSTFPTTGAARKLGPTPFQSSLMLLAPDEFCYMYNASTKVIYKVRLFSSTPVVPVANDDYYALLPDQTNSIDTSRSVLLNDTDLNFEPLSASVVVPPPVGSLSFQSDGTFTYTPPPGFSGEVSFSYVASDGTSNSTTAIVRLNISPSNSGMIAWWRLNESSGSLAYDAAGSAHGTLRNGGTWRPGILGGAVQLGGNAYIEATLDVSETSYTASLWFKTSDANCGLFSVDAGTLGGNGHDRHIYLLNGNISARVYNDEVIRSTGLNLSDGNWHHVAHVFGGSEGGQRLYVDGILCASGTRSNSTFTGQTGVNLGFSNDASKQHLNGYLDDVRIYNRALTPAEVTGLIPQLPPSARADFFATIPGRTLQIITPGVLANDSDVNGDIFSAVKISDPLHGIVTLAADGSFVYVPAAGFTGEDSFTYVARDAGGDSELSVVSIQVSDLTEGLLAHWKLDETSGTTALDATGNGHNGTLQGSPSWTSGIHAGGLSFDGTAQYVVVPHASALDPINGWTLSTWVYRSNAGVQHCLIEKYDWVSGKGNFALRILSNNLLSAYLINGQNFNSASGITPLAAGKWHHVAATYDAPSQKLKLYLNGSLESTVPAGLTPLNSTNALKLGARGDDSSNRMNGILDDARVYDRALSFQEIRALADLPPVASADSFAFTVNGSLNVEAPGVLINDTDIDGELGSAELVSGPASGTLVLNPDGSFSFSPPADYAGPALKFSYRLRDPLDNFSNTVSVILSGPSPLLTSVDPGSADLNTLATLTLTGNNLPTWNGNTSALTPVAVRLNNGVTSKFASGVLTSTIATLTCSIDLTGLTAGLYDVELLVDGAVRATLPGSFGVRGIFVTAPNGAEAWLPGGTRSITWSQYGFTNVKIELSRDAGATWETISSSISAYPPVFQWVVAGPPSKNCIIRVSEPGNTASDVSDAVFTINAPPVAANMSISTLEDTAYSGVLNASDADESPITSTLLSTGLKGVAVITDSASGAFTYTPNAFATGTDTFTYQSNDGIAQSNIATVTVTITPQLPVAMSMNPSPGKILGGLPDRIDVVFSRPLLASSVNSRSFELRRAGDDGLLGTLDDVKITPRSVSLTASYRATMDLSGLAGPADLYQVKITGSASTSVPVAYWNLDEAAGTTTSDLTGNGNTGTLINAPTWISGVRGTGLRFDGASQYVNTSNTTNLPRWTIAAWTRSPHSPQFAPNGSGPVHREKNYQINWDHPLTAFRSTVALRLGGTWQVASFGNLNANTWYHLAGSFDGRHLKAYVNGVQVSDTDLGFVADPDLETATLKLGAHALSPNANGFFNGDVDEPAVFDRVLSTEELQQLYMGTTFGAMLGANQHAIDGDFADVFPSGDGFEGGDFISKFTIIGTVVANNGVLNVTEDTAANGNVTASGTFESFEIVNNGTKGSVVLTDPVLGTYIYTPHPDANGTDIFSFRAKFGSLASNTAIITVQIAPTNDPPAASSQNLATDEDVVLYGRLGGSDIDADTLSFSIVTNGLKGTAVITNAATGDFTYTPAANQYGSDWFTFEVNDGFVTSNIATVQVTITAINDAPIATDGSLVVEEGGSADGMVSATDVDSSIQSYRIVTAPSFGSVIITNAQTGAYTYVPNAGVNGVDVFEFKANDGQYDSNSGTIAVTIGPVNNTPIANSAFVPVQEDTPIQILLSASDSDNDPLTFSIVSNAQHGSIILNELTGELNYTPEKDFNGMDSVQFRVTDNLHYSVPATLTISVAASNDSPTIIGPLVAAPNPATPGEAVTFISSTTDPDGDTLSYAWDFGDGTTSFDSIPIHIYNQPGSYTTTLTVSDPLGASATATITIVISMAPIVHITTEEVMGISGVPLLFHASYSTDPEKQILLYSWNFGDGSPPETGPTISKMYEQPGTYIVVLTVTDADGVSSSLTRLIEVMSAEQIKNFSGWVTYTVKWNREKRSKDTLNLYAQLNVGDDIPKAGAIVALDIVGQHFGGKLDAKLRSRAQNVSWIVKGLKKMPSGSVSLNVKIRNADLGLGFNKEGALPGGDPRKLIDANIPVGFTLGVRTFEIVVPSEFKFDASGKRARGEGGNK